MELIFDYTENKYYEKIMIYIYLSLIILTNVTPIEIYRLVFMGFYFKPFLKHYMNNRLLHYIFWTLYLYHSSIYC